MSEIDDHATGALMDSVSPNFRQAVVRQTSLAIAGDIAEARDRMIDGAPELEKKALLRIAFNEALVIALEYTGDGANGFKFPLSRDECPEIHRPPEGPNEDVGLCDQCGAPSWEFRTEWETFGEHLPECSLPMGHPSYCVGGGAGHPKAAVIRG